MQRLQNLGFLDVILILYAVPMLAFAGLAIRFSRFSSYSGWLGVIDDRPDMQPPAVNAAQVSTASQIGVAVHRAARIVFWRCECMPQAMVCCALLRRAGIEYVATIGACIVQGDKPSMLAHAWVSVGDRIVCGKITSALQTPLAHYRPASTVRAD